jgi:hypothetical protein
MPHGIGARIIAEGSGTHIARFLKASSRLGGLRFASHPTVAEAWSLCMRCPTAAPHRVAGVVTRIFEFQPNRAMFHRHPELPMN